MSAILRPPGRHLGDRDPVVARVDRDLRAVEEGRHPWHVILTNGVDLVTECVPFAEFLVREGRVLLAVGTDALGRRVEVLP